MKINVKFKKMDENLKKIEKSAMQAPPHT